MSPEFALQGPRQVIRLDDERYPEPLKEARNPPERLYVIGNPGALTPGLAVIGARKATPYGMSCARHFARIAAEKGACIISGGARGCDSEAHRAALEAKGQTVAFLGGGCDRLYPAQNQALFQRIIDSGGAVASEHEWSCSPRPYMFRERNRLIAGLASAVLIVEAGLPSGTFSTADDALAVGKEVLVVPGAITSECSHGSNRLLYQGAVPIVDDETFEDALFATMGFLRQQVADARAAELHDPVIEAVLAEPADAERLLGIARLHYGERAQQRLGEVLAEAEAEGLVVHHPDGRWYPNARR